MTTHIDQQRYEMEARSRGWSWMDLKGTGQRKVKNWWHKDRYNVEGSLQWPAGGEVPNLPDLLDANMRRARKGMLPYPPSDMCLCEWCTAKRGTRAVGLTYQKLLTQQRVEEVPREGPRMPVEGVSEPKPTKRPPPPIPCTEAGCDYVTAPGSPRQMRYYLRRHLQHHMSQATKEQGESQW